MVYTTAFSIVRNEQDAEEVAQEALFKAFKGLRQFRGDCKFSTWIVQIAMNEARLRLRRSRRAAEESIDCGGVQNEEGDYIPVDFADWREIPSESLQRKELREVLQNAVSSLKSIYREVLILRDVQHMSVAEAAALGISEASVKTRLLRARFQVRDMLAPGFDGYGNMGGNTYKRVRPF